MRRRLGAEKWEGSRASNKDRRARALPLKTSEQTYLATTPPPAPPQNLLNRKILPALLNYADRQGRSNL